MATLMKRSTDLNCILQKVNQGSMFQLDLQLPGGNLVVAYGEDLLEAGYRIRYDNTDYLVNSVETVNGIKDVAVLAYL